LPVASLNVDDAFASVAHCPFGSLLISSCFNAHSICAFFRSASRSAAVGGAAGAAGAAVAAGAEAAVATAADAAETSAATVAGAAAAGAGAAAGALAAGAAADAEPAAGAAAAVAAGAESAVEQPLIVSARSDAAIVVSAMRTVFIAITSPRSANTVGSRAPSRRGRW